MGSWHIEDANDRLAVFTRIRDAGEDIWLMDVRGLRLRRAFAHAVTPLQGWWISGVEVSDSWIAWEELAPGDDLIQACEWRLYSAPLDRATLTVGEPRLIVSGVNTGTRRPLFDITGSRLVWLNTTWASRGTVEESRLMFQRLDSEEKPRELYRSPHGMLMTVSLRGGDVTVTEVPRKGSRWTRLLTMRLATSEILAAFEVPSRYGLSHWPAWRRGWVAWAPFPLADFTEPTVFLQTRSGRVYRTGGWDVDPVFIGPYMFYGSTHGVRAIRLTDMRVFVLEGYVDRFGGTWSAPYSAPDLRHTYFALRNRYRQTNNPATWHTTIRVYDVK